VANGEWLLEESVILQLTTIDNKILHHIIEPTLIPVTDSFSSPLIYENSRDMTTDSEAQLE